jgi:hypothetical protein
MSGCLAAALVLAAMLAPLTEARAQDRQPLLIPLLSGPVQLDGFSDEAAWQEVELLPLVVFTPNFGEEPTERTEIRVAHDGRYLYMAGRMYDSDPRGIRAISLRRDDGSLSNDWLVLNLDTFGDRENTAVMGVTPSGVRTDMMYDDVRGTTNFDWNTFWDAAVQITEEGWFVEMRIPFASLRFQERDGVVQMGMGVWRNIARKNELNVFPAIPPDWGFFSITKASELQPVVLEGVRGRRPLYGTPYLLGGTGFTHALNGDRTAYEMTDRPVLDFGADVKFGITNNLTLDLSYNTDFAQVEADDQQVNLTRFSLFFPEKRQFFQERASVFAFGTGGNDQLFYSRRIGLVGGQPVPLHGGARLVGRLGGWDVGALNMQTAAAGGLPSENFGVVRARRQVLNSASSIGGIVTSRLGATDNAVYGVDALLRLWSEDYLTLNLAQSFTENEASGSRAVDRSLMRAFWQRRGIDGLRYAFDVSRVGSIFNPAVGYILRSDYTRFGDRISYGWRPGRESRLLRHSLSLEGSAYLRNSDRSLETSVIGPRWTFESKTGKSVTFSAATQFEDLLQEFRLADGVFIPEGGYRFQTAGISYSPSAASLLRTGASVEGGGFYDGWRMAASVSPTWNASRYLELGGAYQINRLSFGSRGQLLTAHIARVRSRLMLSTRLSGAAFVQYNSAADAVSANVRFRYNPREGNDLYIVYNEGLNTDRFAFEPVRPFTDSRTLLIKYSHTVDLGF